MIHMRASLDGLRFYLGEMLIQKKPGAGAPFLFDGGDRGSNIIDRARRAS